MTVTEVIDSGHPEQCDFKSAAPCHWGMRTASSRRQLSAKGGFQALNIGSIEATESNLGGSDQYLSSLPNDIDQALFYGNEATATANMALDNLDDVRLVPTLVDNRQYRF